uniref:Adenylate kinase 5ic n=1 Tax=Rhizophora mucronata TaxID=61149 RepID=A0A2P2KH35_RHIMU
MLGTADKFKVHQEDHQSVTNISNLRWFMHPENRCPCDK